MCTSPLIRYRLKHGTAPDTLIGSSTSFRIKSLRELQSYFISYSAFRDYFDKHMDYQYIKCRKCSECKNTYASEWSLRCLHEYQMRGSGCFITLSIDDTKANIFNTEKNLKHYCKRCSKGNRYIKYPINYTLCKGMLLDQLKRMRDNLYKKYGVKIRYFGCGEYGSPENTERPHYHIIIFGYNFSDRNFIGLSNKGFPLYHSEELQSYWPYGIVTVQDVDHRVCMYTAKYVMKKLHFSSDVDYIDTYYGREPEFLVMSRGSCNSIRCRYIDDIIKNCKGYKSLRDLRNPYCKYCSYTRGGIGYDWFVKYGLDVLKIGYCTVDGIKYPIPNYYLELLKLTYPEKYDKYKVNLLNRIDFLEENSNSERSQEKLDVRRKINIAKIKQYQRL